MIEIIISENNLKVAKEYLYRYFDSPIDEDVYDAVKNTEADSVEEFIEKLNRNPIFNSIYSIQKEKK